MFVLEFNNGDLYSAFEWLFDMSNIDYDINYINENDLSGISVEWMNNHDLDCYVVFTRSYSQNVVGVTAFALYDNKEYYVPNIDLIDYDDIVDYIENPNCEYDGIGPIFIDIASAINKLDTLRWVDMEDRMVFAD